MLNVSSAFFSSSAMVSALDNSIGEVFSALHKKDMLDNSIIVFSTDNGGAVEGIDASTGSNWPLRGSKYNMWEGGIRAASFIWSPLLQKSQGTISKNLMHISDWLPTLYAAAGNLFLVTEREVNFSVCVQCSPFANDMKRRISTMKRRKKNRFLLE